MNCIARLSRPYSKTQPTWRLICKFGKIKEQITSFFGIIFALRQNEVNQNVCVNGSFDSKLNVAVETNNVTQIVDSNISYSL